MLKNDFKNKIRFSLKLRKEIREFFLLIPLFFCMILIIQCSKDTVTLDKKITLNLYQYPNTNQFNNGSSVFSTPQTNFAISDYQNIDSISFVLSDVEISYNPLYVFDNILTKDTISVELINLGDNTSLSKSKIKTVGTGLNLYTATKNLINDFSSNPINIGMKVTSNYGDSSSWKIGTASLVLIRK